MTQEEIINEKNAFTNWKNYVIALGLTVFIIGNGISNKIEEKKERLENIYLLVNDINYKPSNEQQKYLDRIRMEIINDIKINNRISESDKESVIAEINNIKIIIVSKDNLDKISDKDIAACYIAYSDANLVKQKVIFIDKTQIIDSSITLKHELYHLVDNILGKGNGYYSQITDIVSILDKDIITKTPLGIKKLEDKLNFFITRDRRTKAEIDSVRKASVNRIEKTTQSPERLAILKKVLINDFKALIYSNTEYIIDPSEVYVRYNGLRQWLLKANYIKDINEPITKKIIIDIFSSNDIIEDIMSDRMDHFELLFFLNINPRIETQTEEETNTLKKINSIVTNYSDYNKDSNIS